MSRFAFGTASLHHVGTAAKQVSFLRAAADAGFSHFDTAPLYGYGAAERALGKAFSGAARDCMTIATKVGLYPPGGTSQGRRAVLARKAFGRVFSKLSRAQANWCVGRARVSLDGSLRRLDRDYIDLLLLHEPDIDVLATDEWLRWLEDEKNRVLHFGVAGRAKQVAPFVGAGSPLAQVVQTQDSLERREAEFLVDAGRTFQFTYGFLSGAPSGARAEVVLARALSRSPTGAIIVSTRNRERLAAFAIVAAEDRERNKH